MQTCGSSFCHYFLTEDLKPMVYIEMILALATAFYLFYIKYYIKIFNNVSLKMLLKIDLERIKRSLSIVFLQKRILRDVLPGSAHLMIFYSFLILFIATLIRAIDNYSVEILGTHVLYGLSYEFFKLTIDLATFIGIIGIGVAYYRRVFKLTKDLPDTPEDRAVLIILLIILLTGLILDGINYLYNRSDWSPILNPGGYIFSLLFKDLDEKVVIMIYRSTWILHLTVVMTVIAISPLTKLFHLIISSLNVYYSENIPKIEVSYRKIENIEKIVEEGRYIGAKKFKDLTWLQRLNYFACTKCARCHNLCPANISGKILSPMNLVIDMRSYIEKNNLDQDIMPLYIQPETVWSCVTCGACVANCPVMIDHVNTIADLRRAMFSTGENIPDEILSISYNIMRTGNPYSYNPVEREEWVRSLISKGLVKQASAEDEYDILFWAGCNIAYDNELRKAAEALLEILRDAGLKIAMLTDETCCGEPARRIGDELSFWEIARNNYEKLSQYRFKRLLIMCPHGYTVFKNEYPALGFKINAEIIHHSMILRELIEKGVVKPGSIDNTIVTYHDPCYLGRWNKVYEEPREVIKSIKGVEFIDMPRNRERSFCCGGGGGHLYFEIKRGVRISKLRVEEASKIGAKILVTACPYCNLMLRAEAREYNIEVIDLVMLLKKSFERK